MLASSSPPWWHVPIAGGIAGMTVDLLLFRLDTIKTRLQSRPGAAGSALPAGRFYRGIATQLAQSFPSAAVFFFAYDRGKSFFGAAGPLASNVLAAASAELAMATLRSPFELVKQRLQVGRNASAGEALRELLAQPGGGGVRALYTGFGSLLARELPFAMIQYPLNDHLKSAWARAEVRRRGADAPATLNIVDNALLGFVAGGAAAAVTTPLDVVKTRLMTQQARAAPAAAANAVGGAGAVQQQYAGVRDAFVRIWREEGPAALLNGIRQRVAMLSVGAAIFLGANEEAKRRLQAAYA